MRFLLYLHAVMLFPPVTYGISRGLEDIHVTVIILFWPVMLFNVYIYILWFLMYIFL